jgi:hypothetical protein
MSKRIRPIVPLSEQIPGQVAATTGIRLFLPNGTQYLGVYYVINGKYINTPSLQANTVELLTRPRQSTGNDVYDALKENLVDKFISPKHFIPIVAPEDIAFGSISRYFVTKRNEPGIFIEISKTQYDAYSTSNSANINANIWKRFTLNWAIAGEREQVIASNRKTVTVYERDDKLTGLSKFLFKFDEFYLGKR